MLILAGFDHARVLAGPVLLHAEGFEHRQAGLERDGTSGGIPFVVHDILVPEADEVIVPVGFPSGDDVRDLAGSHRRGRRREMAVHPLVFVPRW